MDALTPGWIIPLGGPLLFQAPPGWRWRRGTVDHWNCWCALAGRGELRCQGRSFALRAGLCFLLPPEATIEVDHDQRDPVLNLALHVRFAARGRSAGPVRAPRMVDIGDPQVLTRLADDCLAAWDAGGSFGRSEYAGLATAFVARLHRLAATPHTGHADAALADLVREIRRRPGEPWTVADCAQRLGLSRSQTTRRFQTAYGVPPATIITRARDDYALHLLRESVLPLAEIAVRAGYVDASHLGRRLRRRLGRTPGTARSGS